MKKNKNLKVIPLGGLHEIGKNITVFEYENSILIVDCGITFPEQELLGVDIVIPNFSYLVENMNKVKGIVITHGHEDHLGAIPYLLNELRLDIPIYGTPLTLGLLEFKLKERKMLEKCKLITTKAGESIKVGCFDVELLASNHSIADSVMLAIHTPVGIVLHTSDFKIDYTPLDGRKTDLNRIAQLGEKGIKLLLADSTNVEFQGTTMSESKVGDTFDEMFKKAKGRIIVATFASNVHRLQQIVNASKKSKRRIAIFGRSMQNVTKKSMELGYLELEDKMILDPYRIKEEADSKLVLMTTGSQGEPMAALTRMSLDTHRDVRIKKGDTVIISASVIPGNEKDLYGVINNLFKLGATVIYESIKEIHASGHAKQEELKLIHSLAKAEYFMPVHGEYRHLQKHANLANDLGMNNKNIFIMNIGDVLEVSDNEAKITGKVTSGRVLVDGLSIGEVGTSVLRDRKHLSENGMITVVAAMDSNNNEIISGPYIMSKGFVHMSSSEEFIEELRKISFKVLDGMFNTNTSENEMKKQIRNSLKNYIYRETKRSPMILPIIMEI